jgi:hypothetical protein
MACHAVGLAKADAKRNRRNKPMLKKTLIGFTFVLLSVLVIAVATPLRGVSAQPSSQMARSPQRADSAVATAAPTGTLQKMIVENGSVTMDLDLNRLSGISSAPQNLEAHFAVGANSFFPILVFNDQLRGPVPGSMALIPSRSGGLQSALSLPAALGASLKQLVVEKLPSGQGSDLAVRDGNTGFTFFNIEGHHYDYDAAAQSLAISNGRLLVSKEFANALGRPSEAGSTAGTISIGAVMQPIQIDQLVNGETKSMTMPPIPGTPNLVPGPDVIVGDVEDVAQLDSAVGTQVGLAIGTDSCNNGDTPVNWLALPQTDHPVVPQNLYRMSGGATNDERFEQIGQSWMKHTFLALQDTVCGTCNQSPPCNPGPQLCPGCSDPYWSGLNGDQNSIGSRAWVNPFTGSFPSNANDHSGHSHNGVSHRILVETSDLIPANNPGATYYGEAAYISPHEYTWCQSHPDQCNMFNNFSRRQFTVSGGPTSFNFSPVGNTVRMEPAIEAWVAAGATLVEVEPDPGNDGKFFVGYKVTPTADVWHYEYAIFNMNLDRAIQSFQVFFPNFFPGTDNVEFHAPPQHPGWPHDGTVGDAGYSSAPWTFTEDTQGDSSATWNTETFVQNPNANAIRWGTLYNFGFDSSGPPTASTALISFFKTGSPVSVNIQAPLAGGGSPTPTPTVSPTPPVSPTPTPTPTVTPTPTPRGNPPPRTRPTPHQRP